MLNFEAMGGCKKQLMNFLPKCCFKLLHRDYVFVFHSKMHMHILSLFLFLSFGGICWQYKCCWLWRPKWRGYLSFTSAPSCTRQLQSLWWMKIGSLLLQCNVSPRLSPFPAYHCASKSSWYPPWITSRSKLLPRNRNSTLNGLQGPF